MNTISSVRVMKYLTLTMALYTALISVAHTDDLSIKTMILGISRIDAKSYVLIDYNSGKMLAEQNTDIHRDPASLAKIMTGYVIGQAVKAGKFKETDLITIGNDVWVAGNLVFKGSSLMSLKPDAQTPAFQLIHGINLQSGSDICVAMADLAAGSRDAFVGLMNSYVNALGLGNIHFQTVHGLDAGNQYSSMRDVALISQALIRDVSNEYSIYKKKELTFSGIRQPNRNDLLWDSSLNIDGIETGHTDKTGYNLVASATEGQVCLISAVVDGRTFKGHEVENKKLLTWGSRLFETVDPLRVGKEFVSEPIWSGDSGCVSSGVDKDVHLTIPHGHMRNLKASYVLNSSELHALLQKNQVVRTINFQLDDKTIEQRLLVVLQRIPEGSFFGKVIDYVRLIFHHWFG